MKETSGVSGSSMVEVFLGRRLKKETYQQYFNSTFHFPKGGLTRRGCWAAASAALPASRPAAAPVGQPTRRRWGRPTETWPPWLGARRGSRRTRRWICPRLRRGERPGGRPGRWGGNGSWSGRSPRRSLGKEAQWGKRCVIPQQRNRQIWECIFFV